MASHFFVANCSDCTFNESFDGQGPRNLAAYNHAVSESHSVQLQEVYQ